jgi:F1F0 ATPase subunit 2
MSWVIGLIVGASVGLVSFGGLWWTVQRIANSQRAWWLTVSSLGRLTLVATVFLGLSREGSERVLAGLAGLWLARWWLIRQVSPHLMVGEEFGCDHERG